MLENGMVVGAAREWDAICDAGNADADTAADCLSAAVRSLNTESGFAAAVDQAQADGGFDGKTIAALLFASDTSPAWKALSKLADDLIEAAIDVEFYADGKPCTEYADISRKSVSLCLTLARKTAVAERIAEKMAVAGALA